MVRGNFAAWLRQNGQDPRARSKLARFLHFEMRLPGKPENHPSVAPMGGARLKREHHDQV